MKRIRRRFAPVVVSALVVAGTAWSEPRSVDAHTCLVLKVGTVTVKDNASCVGEAMSPPSDHVCPRVTTTVVTVILCLDLP